MGVNLERRTKQYQMTELITYIEEHIGKPMTKEEIREAIVRLAHLEPKTGRAKSEQVTMKAVEEELERQNVKMVKYGKRKHQKGEPQYYTFEESDWAKWCASLIA